MKVTGCFLYFPAIENLVQNKEPHPVSQIQQFGGWRIMRHPNRVATKVPKDLKVPLSCSEIEGCSYGPQVVVLIYALDAYMLAVDEQPLIGIKNNRPNAKRSLVIIYSCIAVIQGCDCYVHIGLL